MKRAKVGSAGSTLIEVMVAVITFMVVIGGLATSVSGSRKTGSNSRQMAEATTLALDKIEDLRRLPLANAEVAAGTFNDAANPLRSNGTTGGVFTRTWTVTQNVPVSGMRQVRVRVTWRDRRNNGSVSLYTYLSLS